MQQAAVEDASEQILALLAAIEPVAVLVEVSLQVSGADTVEDIQCPALEVGDLVVDDPIMVETPAFEIQFCSGPSFRLVLRRYR